MFDNLQTLLSYLNTKDPAVDALNPTSRKNSSTKHDDWFWPVWIEPWKTFDFKTMMSPEQRLEALLHKEFSFAAINPLPSAPHDEVRKELCLTRVIYQHHYRTVNEALRASQKDLGVDESCGRIFMMAGDDAELPPPLPRRVEGQTRKPGHPDWSAVKTKGHKPNVKEKRKNMLPGETKLSKKWQSKLIKNGRVFEEYDPRIHLKQRKARDYNELWLPLRQIFSYCVLLEVQYGYIITDEELCVIQIGEYRGDRDIEYREGISQDHPDSQGSYKPTEGDFNNMIKHGLVKYRSIPWTSVRKNKSGSSRDMTVNMGLWWLHMIVARENGIVWDMTSAENESLSSLRQPVTNSFRSEVSGVRQQLNLAGLGKDDIQYEEDTEPAEDTEEDELHDDWTPIYQRSKKRKAIDKRESQ